MKHLTEAELVDLVDGTLGASRVTHLETCGTCRTAETVLREMLVRAGVARIPEPSPLFWEPFSARVREGVRESEAGERSHWTGWAATAAFSSSGKWALSGAVLTLLLVAAVWRASSPAPGRVPPATTAQVSTSGSVAAPDADVSIDDAFDPDTDEAWALVRTVADDVSWDDAAAEGVGVRPGSVERALMALSVDERSELVRLLQAETKQPGA